ncbi:hypothetical protein [Fibrella aquatica]|uniref:hypothetical protein n=1 Tax=Fibrella aquatica TaxID=3242487 RepID=UPI003521D515
MQKILTITPGQVANYSFVAVGWEDGALASYAVLAALVTPGNERLTLLTEGSGVLRTIRDDGSAGFLLTFSPTQTASIVHGTRLVISLRKTGQTPFQIEMPLRRMTNLIA